MSCAEFLTDVYGLALTNGQSAFVKVAIDRVPIDDLTDAEREAAIAIFGDIGGGDLIPRGAWRTVVAAMGRSSGKTEICAGIALYKAFTCDLAKCGPGDVPRAFVIAPDADTAALTIERARARIEESDELTACLVAETKTSLTLRRPSDGRLVKFEVRAAARGGRTIRGRSIVALILDEAALFFGEGFVVNDAEIVKAARPRLLPGAVVLLASTPWIVDEGLFAKLFSENHGKPKTALVAQASTLVMRDNDPDVAEMIEIERAEDPDNCAREYFAEFIAGGSSLFFDAESIALAIAEHEPIVAIVKGAGADIALVRDSSALAIVGRDDELFGLEELIEMKPLKGAPLKLSLVVKNFAEVMRHHELDSMTADGHSREPAREWTDVENITIESAPEGRGGKFQTYSFVRELLREERFRLPNNPRLLAQLRAVRSKPMPGGGFAITSPRRTGQGHGDLVSALVLAAWAANEEQGGPLVIEMSEPTHVDRWAGLGRGF